MLISLYIYIYIYSYMYSFILRYSRISVFSPLRRAVSISPISHRLLGLYYRSILLIIIYIPLYRFISLTGILLHDVIVSNRLHKHYYL